MKPAISREAFAEFCESKPADEEYDYFDGTKCAFAQFLTSIGKRDPLVFGRIWRADGRPEEHAIPHGVAMALSYEPYTFGALAARLREAV